MIRQSELKVPTMHCFFCMDISSEIWGGRGGGVTEFEIQGFTVTTPYVMRNCYSALERKPSLNVRRNCMESSKQRWGQENTNLGHLTTTQRSIIFARVNVDSSFLIHQGKVKLLNMTAIHSVICGDRISLITTNNWSLYISPSIYMHN